MTRAVGKPVPRGVGGTAARALLARNDNPRAAEANPWNRSRRLRRQATARAYGAGKSDALREDLRRIVGRQRANDAYHDVAARRPRAPRWRGECHSPMRAVSGPRSATSAATSTPAGADLKAEALLKRVKCLRRCDEPRMTQIHDRKCWSGDGKFDLLSALRGRRSAGDVDGPRRELRPRLVRATRRNFRYGVHPVQLLRLWQRYSLIFKCDEAPGCATRPVVRAFLFDLSRT